MNVPSKFLEKIAFIIVFLLVILGVYFSRTDLAFYEGVYAREDGPIEWLTFLALLMGMSMNIYRARVLKPFRNKKFILGLYLTAFIFLFGLGEEISWGQRIWQSWFNFQVPEFFLIHNSQGETNIHNLIVGGTKINKLIFGLFLGILIVIYFLILPFLYRKVDKVKNIINNWAIPMPHYYHIIAYIALAGLCELIAGGKKGEILEFGGCWIVLLMCFEPFNREQFSRKSFQR